MLETVAALDVDESLVAAWRARVAQACAHLGWPGGSAAAGAASVPVVVRRHAGGVSLALAAPFDQLFTATEVNEWALCASLVERDSTLLEPLEAALVQAAIEQAATLSDVAAPVLGEAAALERFRKLAEAEGRPDLAVLIHAADFRGLPHVLDEQSITLGAGAGGRTWPLDALPRERDVHWEALRTIPTAVVTGSNGKTTTARLVAACTRAAGRVDGFCCTDGVFVAGELVAPGDYSGPAGTRRVLRDTRVTAAVLETARGAILRRGLAIARADVAIVTNVSSDHFGEYGIDDLEGLADVKLSVAQLVAPRGLLVLNADDDLLRSKARGLATRLGALPALAWFALDFERPELVEHVARGGAACGVTSGRLRLAWGGQVHDLGAIDELPLTVGGVATYNVANLAGAALVAAALAIDADVIRKVFASFGLDPDDNAGRLMRFAVGGVQFVVDYAHNPDGLRGLLSVVERLRAPGGRLITLLGHAGNRRNEDIEELATVAASFRPDRVVVKEDEGHLRGRQPGEVPGILRRALLEAGLTPEAVVMKMSESEAAAYAIAVARPGDSVALLMHSGSARQKVLARLREEQGQA